VKRTVLFFGSLSLTILLFLHFSQFAIIRGTIGLDSILAAVAILFFILGALLFRKKARREDPGSPNLKSSIPEDLGLTQREEEVWMGICKGLSNKEIANHLFVSEHTIKTHVSNLLVKLGVKRRTQAMQRARELGLI
jgi:DNA-binding NarL/FixJ family response regulator